MIKFNKIYNKILNKIINKIFNKMIKYKKILKMNYYKKISKI